MKLLTLLAFVLLLSACNRFDETNFNTRCTKVIDRAVAWQNRSNKKIIVKIKQEIAEAGFKKSDVEVYDKAMEIHTTFDDTRDHIAKLYDTEVLNTYINFFLDSISNTAKPIKEALEKCRQTTNVFMSSGNINIETKKALLKSQLTLLEKDALQDCYNEVGSSSCFWGPPVAAYLLCESDTLVEGDSLKAKAFTYVSRPNFYKFYIDKIALGDTIIKADKNPYLFSFELKNPLLPNYDSKNGMLKNWVAKAYYTDMTTMEEKQTVLNGSYKINSCK